MRNWKRLLPYLLINILVSAATTLGILWWWDRTQQPDPGSIGANVPVAALTQAATGGIPGEEPTLPPLDEAVIQIKNVFGVGDLKTESVRLQRVGDGKLWLTGWKLQDEDGNIYTFPELLLNKEGAVEVYTGAGANTVIELHWSLAKAVWSSGEEVRLFDSAGNLRTTYRIP